MEVAMAATAEYACLHCKQPFIARTADRKRGWARYCSKSCKASRQERKNRRYASLNERCENQAPSSWDDHDEIMSGISDWDYGASDGGLN
jgi:transposase-like protein